MNTVMKTSDRGVGLVITMMVLRVQELERTPIVHDDRRLCRGQRYQHPGQANEHEQDHSGVWLTDARVPMSDGGALDLDQVTVDLQRTRGGPATPSRWHFVGHAQPGAVAPVGSWGEPQVVAVWLSSDARVIDVDRRTGDHAQLVAYAAAFGSGLSHRAVQATVRRHVSGWVEVTSWRVAR